VKNGFSLLIMMPRHYPYSIIHAACNQHRHTHTQTHTQTQTHTNTHTNTHSRRASMVGCRDPTNFYPYCAGFKHEVGAGPGTGFNINIPWTKRGMVDADYMVSVVHVTVGHRHVIGLTRSLWCTGMLSC